jgi:hypothetical protein
MAAHAEECDAPFGTRGSARLGHGSERVEHGSEGVVHRYPFVGVLSEDLEHPETDAAVRFAPRAPSSPLFSHADLFVGMPDPIEAIRCERTTDAPRRPSALPRARPPSLRVASATARARTVGLPLPRDASRPPRDVPPTPRDAPPVLRPTPPAHGRAPLVLRPTPRVRCASPPAARHASRSPRASPPEASECPPVLRASRRARSHPILVLTTPRPLASTTLRQSRRRAVGRGRAVGTPRDAPHARSDFMRFRALYFTKRDTT